MISKRVLRGFNIARLYRYVRLLAGEGREAAERYGVSLWRVFRETVALYFQRGIKPKEYLTLGLADPALSWSDKTKFLGRSTAAKIQQAINARQYKAVFADKLAFRRYFGPEGIPLAEFYGLFDPRTGCTVTREPLETAGDLARFLADERYPEPVFKPVASAEGQMVVIFTEQNGEVGAFRTVDGRSFTARHLFDYLTDSQLLALAYDGPWPVRTSFVVERRIHQHPQLTQLASRTLCTVRVVTILTSAGTPRIVGAAFKLQVRDIGVDNLPHGSLAIGVDLETGRLTTGAYHHGGRCQRYEVHPETGVRFSGLALPFWSDVKDLALRAATIVPVVRTVGWDIAISPTGPVLLEGGWTWCEELLQIGNNRGALTPELEAAYFESTDNPIIKRVLS